MEGWVQSEGASRMRKRRQFTPEFKAQVVLDVLTGVQSQAEACRKHGARREPAGAVEDRLPGEGAPGLRQRLGALGRAGADRRAGAGAGAHDPGERDPKKSLEQAGLTLDEKREMMLLLREQYPIQ